MEQKEHPRIGLQSVVIQV